jgi:hypothetical protein
MSAVTVGILVAILLTVAELLLVLAIVAPRTLARMLSRVFHVGGAR